MIESLPNVSNHFLRIKGSLTIDWPYIQQYSSYKSRATTTEVQWSSETGYVRILGKTTYLSHTNFFLSQPTLEKERLRWKKTRMIHKTIKIRNVDLEWDTVFNYNSLFRLLEILLLLLGSSPLLLLPSRSERCHEAHARCSQIFQLLLKGLLLIVQPLYFLLIAERFIIKSNPCVESIDTSAVQVVQIWVSARTRR